MANPLYGQNKADNKLDNGSYVLVGPTVSIATADVANGDIIGGINIPAGTFVHKVMLEPIVVAAGGTPAALILDVGSSADVDMFLDDVDGADAVSGLGNVGRMVAAGQTAAIGINGKYFAAADRISIKVVAEESTSGSCRIIAICSEPVIPS